MSRYLTHAEARAAVAAFRACVRAGNASQEASTSLAITHAWLGHSVAPAPRYVHAAMGIAVDVAQIIPAGRRAARAQRVLARMMENVSGIVVRGRRGIPRGRALIPERTLPLPA